MESIDVNQTKEMICYVASRMIESKALLTEVDLKIGDGDHGIGMELGFTKVREALQKIEPKTIGEVFSVTGMAMLQSMGGASGIIFGLFFMGGSHEADEATQLDLSLLVKIMEKSLAVIKERGKAQKGDKTMVDAFEPAVEQLQVCLDEKVNITEALAKAAGAAKEGVEKTKQYQAKFGRAKSLMERAIGFQDAGATSVWIIFDSMYRWMTENKI